MSCERCPCPDICLEWPTFCEFAISGNEIQKKHICARSRLGTKPEFPSLAEMAGNAIAAAARAAVATFAGNQVFVSAEVLAARGAICAGCDKLANSRCVLCGCIYSAKIRLATEACPDDPPKWDRVTEPPATSQSPTQEDHPSGQAAR